VNATQHIYFLSDFHLGAPDYASSLQREKKIVQFLNEITPHAKEIFLLGDVFDFWFEYKHVVPRGFTRLLGKLGALTDSGVPIHCFVGNHDMWMKDYFEKELNIKVYFEPQVFERFGKKLFIGHGDGLGPEDKGYKRMKKVFRNPISKKLFGALHPSLGIGIANYFSKKSRLATGNTDEVFLGEDKEWLVQYCKRKLEANHYDYFLFGHRHLTMDIPLNENSRYINTGDWLRYNSYAILLENGDLNLEYYKG
jgi:UDP-2,3-diacylglucosamine hydrolase